uniref:NADH-ubiquinone oxidoreductase chain 3 n=1 Tax=Allodiplogaster sudhausi TaxID=2761625 RepID=A0A0U3AWX6_9BILA|nr:NADH dehydrogenase subunit 3 [Allodiplogaster sudhausi]ALT06539.1 NADH dehydrogenase subunit 3 [Allodiplogaster sudhausi]
MISLLFLLTIVFLVLFYLLNFLMSFKEGYMMKMSSFECGFTSLGKVQNSFSVHFFIMMLMFVIFDLEIVMFLGVLVSDINSFMSFLLVIFFIVGGFYMEWWYGKLIWIV